MIDLIPVFFVIFKVVAFSFCMFFAIKWHYDQGKLEKEKAAAALQQAATQPATDTPAALHKSS